jgi:ferrochelatase
MLKSFKLQFSSYFKPQKIDDFFALVFEMDANSHLFLDDESFLKQIDLKYLEIEKTADATILQSHTLFRSTFVVGNSYFKEFFLTPFFIPEFSAIVSFLEKNSFEFKVETMEKIGHFEPYFVNSHMEKKSFGSTNQAVIVETNEELFEREAQWFKDKNLSESTIFLAPYNSKISFNCNRYTSSEILKTIPSNSFRYILILGNKENIIKTLEKQTYQNPSLF